MTNPTMSEIAQTASRAAACAYAAGKFNLSMTYTNVLALAKDALEAEARENEATLSLYSAFPSAEAEQDALEAEREAASSAAWARKAAFSAWEAAQEAWEAEEVRAYEARNAAHAAALEAEEAEEDEGWGDIAIEAWLRELSQGDRDWLCGEEAPQDVAREWHSQGFNALETREWAFRARCFRAAAARALANRGLHPEDCAIGTTSGDTIGYLVSAGDLSSAGAAKALLQV